MEKAFTIQLVSFAPILKSASVKFKEDEKTLMIGKPSVSSGFVIIISCRTLDTLALLDTILPILKMSKASFRVIKSQQDQYRLNAGAFGDDEAGKVVTIFPYDLAEARLLADRLVSITHSFKGPVVNNAQRIGEVVYIQKVMANSTKDFTLGVPNLKTFPFKIEDKFKKRKNPFGLIGKYYLPVQLLRTSAKGSIYKAINLRRLAFEWCLIKQGNPVALDDHFDRDMKDRLEWQREVINLLKDRVYTPAVVDFFHQKDYQYLILDFAEGTTLGDIVREKLTGKKWTDLSRETQFEFLNYFLQAAEIIKTIHLEGFVHRDITDSNFVLLENKRLCIIDFELSYSLTRGIPNPPFLLGTFGYVAPEQIEHAIPDKKEDIYSLGALLCFILTACKTWDFITPNIRQLKVKLIRLTNERELTELILRCLSKSRGARPDLEILIQEIMSKLHTLNNEANEKISMAV